jgi:hypothetical protein
VSRISSRISVVLVASTVSGEVVEGTDAEKEDSVAEAFESAFVFASAFPAGGS